MLCLLYLIILVVHFFNLNDLPIYNVEQPVCIRSQMVVMGDHNQSLLLLPHDPSHQFQDLHSRLGIQIACRLVRKYDPGIYLPVLQSVENA